MSTHAKASPLVRQFCETIKQNEKYVTNVVKGMGIICLGKRSYISCRIECIWTKVQLIVLLLDFKIVVSRLFLVT